jgi:hypothetical protein
MVSFLTVFAIFGSFKVQAFYAIQIREQYPESAPQVMNFAVAYGITAATALATLASLKFMWDKPRRIHPAVVRHNSHERYRVQPCQ